MAFLSTCTHLPVLHLSLHEALFFGHFSSGSRHVPFNVVASQLPWTCAVIHRKKKPECDGRAPRIREHSVDVTAPSMWKVRCRTSLFVLTWVGDCKTNFWDLLHRSPHVFNPRVEMSTRCQICRSVDSCSNSGGQYSTNIMRSFCVSLVFTVM